MFVSRSNTQSIPLTKNATEPAWLNDIRRAITRGNEQGVQEQLNMNDADIQQDDMHDLIDHACRTMGCPLSIKMLLAAHRQTDTQRALTVAVERVDPRFVDHLLQKEEVDPDTGHLHTRHPLMRSMLQSARRLQIFYPAGCPRKNETKLDQALREKRTDEAFALLGCPDGHDAPKLLLKAIRDKKFDTARGHLVLWDPSDSPSPYLADDRAIPDKDVAQVTKEIPYHSGVLGHPGINFNGKDARIVCRHFALDQLEKMEAALNAKPTYDDYEDLANIQRRVSASDKRFNRLKAHAKETYLIDNRDFGQFLAQQFEEMERKGESTKLMLMTSTNHAMALSLRIKVKDGKKVYVARLFDPNKTLTHARSASSSRQAFALQHLQEYLGRKNLNEYYPESKGLSVLHVLPSKDELTAMTSLPLGAAAGREFDGCIPDAEIDATAIWHFMSHGFSGDLRRLKDRIAKLSVAEQITLLAAKDHKKNPALWMALRNGHADAVEAYGELLLLIPKEQRAKLLAIAGADGTPVLAMALKYGHAGAVEGFGKLLKLIPEGQHAELLAANADGIPALSMALKYGHVGAVEAFGKLLQLIPKEQCDKLIADAVAGFTKLQPWISEEQCAELLAAQEAFGTRALSMDLLNGLAATANAFKELRSWIPEEQRAELHQAAIASLEKLLPLIPEEQRATLREAAIATLKELL
jgi:uncharacterized protein